MAKSIPTPELLRKLLRYNPETGLLLWRERSVEMFSDGGHGADANCRTWNTQFAGTEAFTANNSCGYYVGKISGAMYLAHRVIWSMETGAWPVDQIDHIDHDRLNNRLANLRTLTNQENGRNQSVPSNNTSGHIGVGWNKRAGKWVAYIKVAGRFKHLGLFAAKADAIAARAAADIKYGFHQNHGREIA